MSARLVVALPTIEPVQQGSKTLVRVSKPCRVCRQAKMVMMDAAETTPKTRGRLKRYRETLAHYARVEMSRSGWEPIPAGRGVDLRVSLVYERPPSHLKANGSLRKGKPVHKVSKPDLDKLLRAICDAMTMAEVWKDDSQVVSVAIAKKYAKGNEAPGIVIDVGMANAGLAELAWEATNAPR